MMKHCFIISKFGNMQSKDLDYREGDAFLKFIKNALEPPKENIPKKSIHQDYKVQPVNDDRTTKNIPDKIFEHIIKADLVIANLQPNKFPECSDHYAYNANVFYETGLRHSLNLPIIHFIEKQYIGKPQFPFDLKGYNTFGYEIKDDTIVFDTKALYETLDTIYNDKKLWPFSRILREERGVCYYDIIKGFYYLINWKESQKLEVEADEVYSVTSNLNWTLFNYPKLVNNIINKAQNKGKNRYRFIFVRDEHDNRNNQRILEAYIKKDKIVLKDLHNIDIDKHIQLVSITEAEFNQACNIKDSDEEPMLPKPVDIVLYIETTDLEQEIGKRKYLVMSVNKVPWNITNDDLIKNYDVVFKDRQHIEVVEKWFNHIWLKLTANNPSTIGKMLLWFKHIWLKLTSKDIDK